MTAGLRKGRLRKAAAVTSDTILITADKKKRLIRKDEIEYIIAHRSCTRVYLIGKGIIQVRKLLKSWECILPKEKFIKIRRSVIVNTKYIKEIERYSSRSLRIIMENSNRVLITSQRYL